MTDCLSGRPDRVPVLAVSTVLRALSYVELLSRNAIAVTALWAARATVVHEQLDATHWALSFDHRSGRSPSRITQRLIHGLPSHSTSATPCRGRAAANPLGRRRRARRRSCMRLSVS